MKNILITGGSSGIGFEMSAIFAKQDFNIFWVTINEEEALMAKQRLLAALSMDTKVDYLIQDLSQADAAQKVFNWFKIKNTNLDVLINNAGYGLYGMSHELAMEKELNMIELNVITLYKMTRLFLPDMMKRNSGTIINISSNSSFQPVPQLALYAATKVFVSHYSQALNEELKMSGSKVKVMTICPAAIRDTKFKKAAKMENVKTFEGLVATNKKEVAKDVWNAYRNNKSFVMSGIKLRLLYPIVKLLPRPILNILLKNELSEKGN